MQKSYFSCYPSFRCLAAACPDSCCVGWEIVVDPCTETKYQTVQGTLGQKIRRVLTTDSDAIASLLCWRMNAVRFGIRHIYVSCNWSWGRRGYVTLAASFPV